MATVHETLQELRSEYVSEGSDNLARIDRLIGLLEVQADATALEHLHRRFLGLAGSGYTYGFPVVSTLGRQGEQTCASAFHDGRALTTADLAACRGVLGRLREEFERLLAVHALGPWVKRPAPRARTWAAWTWAGREQ